MPCTPLAGAPAYQLVGDPVDVLTGEVVDNVEDFVVDAAFPITFRRTYASGRCDEDRGLGRGHSHSFDHALYFDLDGIRYVDGQGRTVALPAFLPGEAQTMRGGFVLSRREGNETELDRPDGRRFRFASPSRSGRAALIRVRTPEGSVDVAYDARGRLSSLRGSEGHVVVFTWDAVHLASAHALVDGGTSSVALGKWLYEGDLLVAFEDAYHHLVRYEYDACGRMTRHYDRVDYFFSYAYDDAGRCIHSAGEDGLHEVRLDYFPLEQRTRVTKGGGSVWDYFYDESRTLTSIVGPGGVTRSFIMRPEDGRIESEVDGAGNERTYVYDERGRVVGHKDAQGRWVVGARGHRVPIRPDEFELGELARKAETYPEPNDLRWALPPAIVGALVYAQGAHDGKLREVRNIQGLLIREERDGKARRFAYDPNGNFRWDIDFDGARTDWTFASLNELVDLRDANGNVTTFEYTKEDELAAVTDGRGTRTVFPRDPFQQLTGVSRANAWKEAYVRDGAGGLVEKKNAAGATLYTLKRGPQGEVLARDFASGGFEKFVYDDELRVVEAATQHGKQTFAYDGAGRRLRDFRDGTGVQRRFIAGDLVEHRVLGRFVTRYRFHEDAHAREVAVTDPTGRTHRIRDQGHGVVTRAFASGRTETIQYHPDGRVLGRFVHGSAAAPRPWMRRFQYSEEGYLAARHDSAQGTTTYQHDAGHRLLAEQPPSAPLRKYEYDASGNLLTSGAGYGLYYAGNLLAEANGRRYEHDVRQAIVTEKSEHFFRRFQRDERDQLVRVETHRAGPDGAWVADAEWTAKYDALGRRIEKCHGAARTVFYWDSDRVAAEIRPDGTLRIYVYVDALALTPLLYVDYAGPDADPASGVVHAVFADHLGCPVRIEDMAGETVWAASIAPYGAARVDLGADHLQPLRWPGHYYDAELGLQYNRFRTYAPYLGRYLEPDPIGRAGGLENVYAYTHNPLASVDTRGLAPCKNCEKNKKQKEEDEEGHPDEELGARDSKGRLRDKQGRFIDDPDADGDKKPTHRAGKNPIDNEGAELDLNDPAVKAALAARRSAQKDLGDARDAGDTEAEKAAQNRSNKATEELGALAADDYAKKRGLEVPPLHSGKGPGTFDRVYKNPSPPPDMVVVEAKGGSSSNTSSRAGDGDERYQQGSTPYRDSVADNMAESKDPGTRSAGTAVRKAAKQPDGVQYVQVSQPIDGSGNPQPIKTGEYYDKPPSGSQ